MLRTSVAPGSSSDWRQDGETNPHGVETNSAHRERPKALVVFPQPAIVAAHVVSYRGAFLLDLTGQSEDAFQERKDVCALPDELGGRLSQSVPG